MTTATLSSAPARLDIGLTILRVATGVIFAALTRLAGFGLAITMLGAIGFVHLSAGFFAPTGAEFPIALLAATTALAFTGAGRYSADSLVASRRSTSAVSMKPARAVSSAA